MLLPGLLVLLLLLLLLLLLEHTLRPHGMSQRPVFLQLRVCGLSPVAETTQQHHRAHVLASAVLNTVPESSGC
jgi:hypothetical protein